MSEWTRELGETGVVGLGELLALKLRAGDVVALSGELGAGKTTLARALIRALTGDPALEVPSPTFSLQQGYEAPRLRLTHFDFYRLAGADEASELGIDEAIERGAVLIEWPERARALLPQSRFEVALAETADPAKRRVTVRGLGEASGRARRVGEMLDFLGQQRLPDVRIAYLQGDASTRSYARVHAETTTWVLMDAPRQPDGPPIRDGKPYSQIAHLAEDMARSFSGVSRALQAAGLSAPRILAEDLSRGLMLVEDLGDCLFTGEASRGLHVQEELWQAAVDVLAVLRRTPAPEMLTVGDGSTVALPVYDREALLIEAELLLDWYWPALHGAAPPADVRSEFLARWGQVCAALEKEPRGWVLRDFHSPNLVWLPARQGVARVGILDSQDAQRGPGAYDLVSLLQDARVDVPPDLEARLFARYCQRVAADDPGFDQKAIRYAYAALGAQRNTKILGIFVRLARRDGKRQYLAHLPRIWGYLERCLREPELAPLAAWYERHFPPSRRLERIEA